MKSALKKIASHWPFPVVATLKSGRKMYVDLRSRIGQGLYVKGEFDPGVFAPIQSALKAGGVFLDIGANVGYYSLLALDQVGPSGTVHAFEIDPRPLRCLNRTVKHYGLANLHVHAIAITNQDGTAVLSQASECGNSYVSRTGQGLAVPTTSIDSWIAGQSLSGIDAIKIDVEGGELPVLQGAMETLQRYRPVLVFEAYEEYQSRSSSSTEAIHDLLTQLGYTTRKLPDCWSPTILATPTQDVVNAKG